MAGIMATRSRTTEGAHDQRRSALDELARRYARLAAGLLEAPIGAVQLEPGGASAVYEAGSFDDGPHYADAKTLCAELGNQLWYGRAPVAIPTPGGEGTEVQDERLPKCFGACLAAPLSGRSGQFLGTICVAHPGEREWTAEEMDRLRALATSASEELDSEEAAGTPEPSGAAGAIDEFVTAALGMLREGANGAKRRASEQDTVEALQAALEELQTSVEELQLMNEELHATRFMVELEREHYRELFECVPHPYLITNQEGIIREVNDAAATLLGARRSFLVGKPLAVFVPEDGRSGFRKRLRELRGGGRMEWSLQVTPRGHTPKSVMCAAAAMRSRDSDAERVYWLFRELLEGETGTGGAEGAAPSETHEASTAKSQDFEELIAQATLRPGMPVVEQLRDLIAGAHDVGSLQVGQRLPSIRAIADRFGVTSYAALQAYAALEAEGVVERRERSGVYVAPVDWPVPPRLPETAEWLASVLTQACEHQVRIPHFPDLVRRWTGSVAIKAACVESCDDSLVALTHELSNRFGVNAVPVPINDLVGMDGSPRRASALPAAIHEAQLLVTTPFHASQLRAIAEATGKPLLVATLNREIVDAVEAHLAEHELTVVCVDRAAGERLRSLQGGAFRDRIRVVLVDEIETAGLDRTQPVFLTLAARQRLNGASLRLVAPPTPSFSLDFARKVSGTLLRLNIDGGRG